MIYSAYQCGATLEVGEKHLPKLRYLLKKSAKMGVLALIYGGMNILSFIALRNISAGMFTVFAQLKILTTATCSRIMLDQQYSMTKWRALFSLMMGVLLFSETTWNGKFQSVNPDGGNIFLGTAAVLIEVTLSGFASIYFEKVIKLDTSSWGFGNGTTSWHSVQSLYTFSFYCIQRGVTSGMEVDGRLILYYWLCWVRQVVC